MSIDDQQRDYLDEHLPYTLKMLRYTHGQMLQQQHYLSWNAHFESFAVHARNLVNFLTSNDKSNFEAKDFVKRYKARIGDHPACSRRVGGAAICCLSGVVGIGQSMPAPPG
jgi:hypothetical protein